MPGFSRKSGSAGRQARIKENVPEFVGSAVLEMSMDGTVISSDRAALDLVTDDGKDIAGSHAASIFPEDWTKLFLEKSTEAVASGKRKIFSYRGDFQGRKVDLENIILPLSNRKNKKRPVCVIITEIDPRERKEDKSIQNELRQTNAFLDSIVENIPNMIFLKDAKDLRFVRFNRAGEELLGYSRDDLLGKNDYDFFPPEQADFFVSNDRAVLSAGKKVDIPEEGIDTRAKGRRILHTQKVPICGETGESEFLLGISEDITDRKRAEDSLRESEEKFRSMVANVPGVVFRCRNDEKWTMIYISEAVEALTGYKASDIRDNALMTFEDIIHSEDRGKVREAIFKSLEQGCPYEIDYRMVTSDGDTRWVRENGRAIKGPEGEFSSIDGVIVDITDHVRNEEEIYRQREVLSNLVDNIPFFVFWKNRESEFLGCNKAFARVSGIDTPSDIEGKTDYELAWKKEEADFYREMDREVMEKGEPILNMEETQLQSDGREAVILTSKVPLKDLNGDVTGVLGVYADITERKEMEKKLTLFMDLINQSSDSLFLVDSVTGRFLYVNDQACFSLEHSRQDLLSMSIMDIDTLLSMEYEWKKAVEEMKVIGSTVVRTEHIRRSGKTFSVEVNMKYVELQEDGYIVFVARDISERIKFEEQLKDSESKYKTMFENTGTITAMVNGDMTISMANSEFERFFGFSSEDTDSARKIDEFVSEEDVEKMRNYHRLRRIDDESTPRKYEIKMVDASGEDRDTYVTVAIVPGTDKSVLSFLDLTELKEKENELKKQRDLLDSTNKVLERKIGELNHALIHIKKLEGLVPICSGCKKIMKEGEDPKNTKSWVNIEQYITERSAASFTHGLCPDCITRLYGERLRKKSDNGK